MGVLVWNVDLWKRGVLHRVFCGIYWVMGKVAESYSVPRK